MSPATNNKTNSKVITRIYINAEGDLIVTDLWDEVRDLLAEYFPETKHEADENL